MKGQRFRVSALSSLFALLLVIGFNIGLITASMPPRDSDDVCRYFKNNTKIRDPHSCTQYITCIDFVSHYTECASSTPFYDKDTEKCVKTLPEDNVCDVSCEGFAGQFVPDPSSCKGYFYCHDEQLAIPGKCPHLTHFHFDQQACIMRPESECATEKFDFCSIIKNGVKFMDEKHCGQYNTCTKGVLKSTSCKDTKYYDPGEGDCIDKHLVDCLEHPLWKNGCGSGTSGKKNVFIEDKATCRGFFFCAQQEGGVPDPNPYWGQCPPDYFFSDSKKSCLPALDVKCTWNRCEGRSATFVTSSTKGCRNYFICKDGMPSAEKSCGNLFFDERRGICTTDVIKETACT